MPANLSKYPGQIDTTGTTLPDVIDNITPIDAKVVNRLRDAILNVEAALGANPAKIYGTVRQRLDSMELLITNSAAGNVVSFNGDLTGALNFQNVVGFQGRPIANTTPGIGEVLTWSGSQWIPAPGSVTLGGDLGGTPSSELVIGLYGHPLANTSPVASAVPVYNTVSSQYDVRQLTLDDLGVAFAISSFSGGSTQEVGATVTNPAFTASYSSPATSAQITNTDGINSPKVLTTPFTSGTVTGAFTKSTVASVTFTLTAVGATTKTANTAINFFARSFIGIGTAGATSATASGTNATLVGATGTLATHNLASTVVGSTTASQSPTGQKIYFMCVHTASAHSFKDGSGFQFAFNAPTTFSFTNVNGSVLSYDLYESTNLLSTPFALTVVS